MNEQELRAQFELIYADLIGDRIARFTFRKSGDEYHYHDVEDAFQMYKRAKLQSEQRMAELEAVQPSALKEKLRSAESHIAELESAITKMIKCKGRYHTEQNTIALAKLVGIELPPKEHPEPSCEELKAENERLKAEAQLHPVLMDRKYRDGLTAGWNLGVTGDNEQFDFILGKLSDDIHEFNAQRSKKPNPPKSTTRSEFSTGCTKPAISKPQKDE